MIGISTSCFQGAKASNDGMAWQGRRKPRFSSITESAFSCWHEELRNGDKYQGWHQEEYQDSKCYPRFDAGVMQILLNLSDNHCVSWGNFGTVNCEVS